MERPTRLCDESAIGMPLAIGFRYLPSRAYKTSTIREMAREGVHTVENGNGRPGRARSPRSGCRIDHPHSVGRRGTVWPTDRHPSVRPPRRAPVDDVDHRPDLCFS